MSNPSAAGTLRVMSYNVRSLRDDVGAVDAVLREASPDLVCVQEAPRFFRWRHACSELARRAGLTWIGGGRDGGANILLASMRVEVLESRSVLFSKRPGLHQRGAALAVVRRVSREPFLVAGTHFSLSAGERRAHLDELLAVLEAYHLPVVLAGDINETPDSPVWRELARRLPDPGARAADTVPTYPAREPIKRIDGVFAGGGARVVSTEVLSGAAVRAGSDHCPVTAEIAVGAGRGPEPDHG